MLRFRRLRTRFFAAMILVTLVPLMILGYVSFNIAKDTLTNTNARSYEEHLETSSEVADLLFRNIINLNRSLVVNNEIRQDMIRSSPDHYLKPPDAEILSPNRVDRTVNMNMLDTRFIHSICVLDLQFQASCSGRSNDAGIYEGPDKAERITGSDWYKETVEAQGRILFLPGSILTESPDTFSTAKLFRDAVSGEAIGLLIISVERTIFDEVFTKNNPSGGFLVLDATLGPVQPVYSSSTVLGQAAAEGGTLDQVTERLDSLGYLVSAHRNRTTDWTFLHVIETKELVKQSRQIGWVTTLLATSMAVLSLLLAYIISGSITRPLLLIKKMMIEWMQGVREFDAAFENDEVGAIGQTFKRMAAEHRELSEKLVHSELKEKEAELRALQAQIKPHFLYNTLDSIYWMATIQKNREIAQMAVSLSESFKLSLNKGKEMITVFKELKHIQHYMTIQNIRYNNRFEYIEDVEPSIMGLEVMKLLLQPLVENAIYHGLEPKVGPGTVRLTGRREEEFLVFTVEDNGVGMEDLSATEQGYGMRNVRERLQLFYGPTGSIEVRSAPGEGTAIQIRFKP